jgi:hypothetical protein
MRNNVFHVLDSTKTSSAADMVHWLQPVYLMQEVFVHTAVYTPYISYQSPSVTRVPEAVPSRLDPPLTRNFPQKSSMAMFRSFTLPLSGGRSRFLENHHTETEWCKTVLGDGQKF